LFHENGQTDKHDEGNSRFPQFCEDAQEVKGFEGKLYSHTDYLPLTKVCPVSLLLGTVLILFLL